MASPNPAPLPNYDARTFSPSAATPPPPPPKPSASSSQTPSNYPPPPTTGPPLPPPPPSQPLSTHPQDPTPQPHPPPPDPLDHWLPEVLLDKPSQTLHTILTTNPALLTALSQTHPSLHPSPLPPHLHTTAQLATHLSQQYAALLALRQRTQSHLLHLHALERQWRDKQAQMDKELAPWSAKVLYQRLREAGREGEEWSRGLEGSWLDGMGEEGEREVGEFLKGFREGRVRVGRRREGRERWDEGRVGGWR